MRPRDTTDPLSEAIKDCRPLIAGAVFISLFVSLLNLAVPIYSMQVFDRVLSSGSVDTLTMLTVIVVGAVVFMGVLQGLRSLLFTQIGRWLDDRLSGDLVTRILNLVLIKPGLGAQPMRDLGAIRGFVASPVIGTILDAPWAILFFLALFVIHATIGWVVVGAAAILLLLAILAQRVPAGRQAASQEASITSYAALEATLRNAEVVRAMGMGAAATEIWRRDHDASTRLGYSAGAIGSAISNATKTIRLGCQILITGLGAWLVINQEMSMGAIIAVNMLSGKALAPFDQAVAMHQGWTNFAKARDRLREVFAAGVEGDGNLELPEPTGALSIANLTYQEPASQRWLLRGVNFEAEAGEAIGVIGPSGGGKTTLARLLTGVKRPTSGAVKLDGGAVSQWRPDQFAAAIGYLPQDIELFSGTVAQNIARMTEGAEDAEIVAAAKLAEIHDFALTLPEGYQTDIGRNGAALSAGQRQRIALARCFFGAPKLVVLDEPNANLDTDGDNALVQCLRNAKAAGITTVTIAHRPALLHHVDKIAVLNGGELALFGPTKEVMERLAGANRNTSPLKIDRAVAS